MRRFHVLPVALLGLLLAPPLAAQVATRTLASPTAEANGGFGDNVAGVPDANGDGRGDLLVGAPSENGGATDAGRAYLFSGATGALLRTLTSPNAEVSGAFGEAVAGVPDADGLPEDVLVVVGAGHLVGPGSVVEMLRARGLDVVRVE